MLRILDILARSSLLSLSLLVASSILLAQQPVDPSPLPSDPVAFMLLAYEKNGLTGADVRPWHIRGSYSIFDGDGTAHSGIYEEWWAGPEKYKRSYKSTEGTRVDYANGVGLYREGPQEWPSGYELLLRSNLVEPLPSQNELTEFQPQWQVLAAGPDKLKCVRLFYALPANRRVPDDFFQTYCFDSKIPILYVESKARTQVTYNQLVGFRGHYLAKEVHLSLLGRPKLEMKLELIETLKETPDDLFKPPAGALPVDLAKIPLQAEKNGVGAVLLKSPIAVYPESAKAKQIQGTVIVRFIVGKDGHVLSPRVVSGPYLLQQSALDAVQQSLYRPFRVMGNPVEVETQFEVHFDMR